MSGAQTSTFYPVNQMLQDNAQQIQNYYAPQKNQLAIQEGQQKVGQNEMEVLGRAALPLLNMSETDAAAAYPGVVQGLRDNGYAKNAPSAYPGHAAMQNFVSQAIPVEDQYKLGIALPPGLTSLLTGNPTPGGQPQGTGAPPASSSGTTLPIPGRGTGGPGASLSASPEMLGYFREASAATGIPMDLLIAQARQESGFNPNAKGQAGEIGVMQIKPSTAASQGYGMQGVDPASLSDARNNIMFGAQYLKARGGPGDPNDPAWQARALGSYNAGGDPNYVANVFRYRPGMSPTDPAARVTTYAAGGAPAQPGAPPGAPGATTTPPPYRTASLAPVPPPGPTAPPGGAPATTPPANAPQAQPQQVTPQVTPQGVLPAPQSPPNQIGPGGPNGPPAPSGPAPQPQAPATGLQSPQMQQAWEIQRQISQLIPYSELPQVKARIAQLQAQSQMLMQADVMQPTTRTGAGGVQIPGDVNVRTNEFKPYPFAPSPRAVEGEATWDGKQWTQTLPGQQGTPGKWSMGGGGQPQFYPTAPRPPQGDYQAQMKLFEDDLKEKQPLNEANQNASNLQIRLGQMRQLVDQINTGAGGAERKDWANVADTMGLHDLAQQLIGKGGAEAAQIFDKYATQTSGDLERATLGSKGSGIGALTLYKNANPGLTLQPGANKQMLNAQLLAAQANRDYSEAALQHVNSNSAAFSHGGQYTPLSEFNEQWAAAKNPQIYTAALRALDGDTWDKWTAGLNLKTADDVQRVRTILERADPTTRIVWKDGQSVPVAGTQ
jgi:hypothetical protein